MAIFHLVVLLIYALVLMGTGLWLGRRVQSTDDFFVAGRKLGPTLIFSTMLAANIGAGSTVAAAGLGYANGLSAWWWVGSAGIGSMVLAFWIGPRMRQPRKNKISSIPLAITLISALAKAYAPLLPF